jgi:hypothetical protein
VRLKIPVHVERDRLLYTAWLSISDKFEIEARSTTFHFQAVSPLTVIPTNADSILFVALFGTCKDIVALSSKGLESRGPPG